MGKTTRQIARRLAAFVLTLLALSVCTFYLSRLAPGDPLRAWYGASVERLDPAARAAAEERLGLNGSIGGQYLHWLERAVHGDFGISLQYKQPAAAVIADAAPNTLLLGGLSWTLIFALAVPLGVYCTLHEDTPADRLLCRAGAAFGCIPTFWIALLLLLVFAVNLGWLPAGGAYPVGSPHDLAGRLRHLILPLAATVPGHLWYYASLVRARLLDETRKPYVLLLRAQGLSNRRIVWGHCLRGALPALLSLLSAAVPHILGGAYLVEQVFSYPGLGKLCFESAKYHDYNLLMLLTLLTGALAIACGMLTDLLGNARAQREGGAK